MVIERGSTWNKWDFHVHTPYSILNNGYGFDPYTDFKIQGLETDPFDEYVRRLFNKAIENNIAAIGVTDYFSIEGYKRIRRDYLDNPLKMESLFPDISRRNKISKIFVFPNIELRLDSFVGKENSSVNYHVIFSDKTPIDDIEDSFLNKLEIICGDGTTLPLNRNKIERKGKEYKEHNPESGSDYHVGLNHITVNYKKVLDILKDSAALKNCFFISIPVDEDLSQISWNGRDYETRKNLYYQCDLLMTSNIKTRRWALAKGHEKDQIDEFGSIKPCIWGSDAHDYNRMFEPEDGRYCWVKAEPTFEGLKQVLYEPNERVRAQKECPEEKDEHQLIDYIEFTDHNNFAPNPIYFSEGLTAIIGGKSTGKSILLRHIAKNVDLKQVQDKEREIYSTNNKFEANAKVFWKDGVSGERKIIYIPQSWLNRAVDKPDGDSQLNKFMSDILLQQDRIHSAYTIMSGENAAVQALVKDNINKYIKAITRAQEIENDLKEKGRSEALKAEIVKLEKQREELSTASGVTQQEIDQYTLSEKDITEKTRKLEQYKKEEPQIEFIGEPFVYIQDLTSIDYEGKYSYNYDSLPTVGDKIEQAINQINEEIKKIWEPVIQDAMHLISDKEKNLELSIEQLSMNLAPIKQKLINNDQLKKIENQLQSEKEKLERAQRLEIERNSCLSKAEEYKAEVIKSRDTLHKDYSEFADKLSGENAEGTDLKFEAKIGTKRKALYDCITSIFDNRNLKGYRTSGYCFTDAESLKIDDGLFETLWDGLITGELGLHGGYTKQSALEQLFSDWNYIHYDVKSGNDNISSMSPGKKALVLLEMIVNLEKGNCPILIDQPEDDLDNRSIYEDLVQYLKAKKHDRQIIVVTHNANVVIGADAEEVIIANQDGKESPNNKYRFEYRCGAIENVSPVYDEDGTIRKGVLNQKGIQEQICDILEGGKDAFELRRHKYFNA